jgi:signal transduction histidine kinase
MPDQDRQRTEPDSDNTIMDDGAHNRRRQSNDPEIESEVPGRSRPDLAVNDGYRRILLGELVGRHTRRGAHQSMAATGHANAGDGRIHEVREETMRRIAQRLHDETSQMLALVYLELANIARDSSESTAERIGQVIVHLDTVCEQMRDLSHELHPAALERLGLVPALRKLAEGLGKRSGLEVSVVGEVDGLPSSVEVGIYRVVQEALANVVRHAGASKAEVRLRQTENSVHCSIKDNGAGLKQEEPESNAGYDSGLGLVGIYERVESLGGECHILSGDRAGMELSVGIPL